MDFLSLLNLNCLQNSCVIKMESDIFDLRQLRYILFDSDAYFSSVLKSPNKLKLCIFPMTIICLTQILFSTVNFFISNIINLNTVKLLVIGYFYDLYSIVVGLFFVFLLFGLVLSLFRKPNWENSVKTAILVLYGYIPFFIGEALVALLRRFGKASSFSLYESLINLQGSGTNYMQIMQNKIGLLGIDIIYIVIQTFFFLWAAKIWYSGLSHTETISTRTKMLISLLPVFIILSIHTFSLFMRMLFLFPRIP